MCELTLAEAGFSAAEISAIPVRRTWYGIAGSHADFLRPQDLTDDAVEAKSRAYTKNKDCPALGPWHVIVLTENLRALQ